jgi:uncharacterized protein (TIGR03435 family)
MRQTIVGAGLLVLFSMGAPCQPAFEVASVKPDRTGVRGSMEFSSSRDRFTATDMPLGALILVAYNITVRQLSGPGEVLSARFDIAAKAEHPVSADAMMHMLQSLLADRFKLVIHRERREVPVYALRIGKGGPKLKPSDLPPGAGVVPRTPSTAGGSESAGGHLAFKDESMPDFAWALSRMAGIGDRVVVDETGLKGKYDFQLTLERDSAPPAGADAHGPAATLGPPIFSAPREQLGLQLESSKALVEFLVVDHAEQPAEN